LGFRYGVKPYRADLLGQRRGQPGQFEHSVREGGDDFIGAGIAHAPGGVVDVFRGSPKAHHESLFGQFIVCVDG